MKNLPKSNGKILFLFVITGLVRPYEYDTEIRVHIIGLSYTK